LNLSDKQFLFAKDIILLEMWMISQGYKYTYGHAWRSDEEQTRLFEKGLSNIKGRGPHGNRLARDYNFFIDDNEELTYDKEKIQPIGDFWESLNPKNKWGGSYNIRGNWDTPHFERLL